MRGDFMVQFHKGVLILACLWTLGCLAYVFWEGLCVLWIVIGREFLI